MNRSALVMQRTFTVLGLFGILACGGGGGGVPTPTTPAPPASKTLADTLSYSNPTTGTYKLVRNESKSSAGHLVLDLMGPAGSVSGIGFYLSADQAKVAWAVVDSGDAEKVKSAVFSSTVVKSQVSGGILQAGVYQKGLTSPVNATPGTVLVSVALDLKSNVAISSPPTVVLSVGKALILNDPGNTSATSNIPISVGTLTAN